MTPEPTPADTPVGTTASRFRAPDTTLILFGILVLAAVLTWFVQPGAFETREIEVAGVGTREVVVPGTFALVEGGRAFGERVVHSLGMILKAPILGIVDPDAAPIIAFVLLIGGAFGVLTATGAVDTGLRAVVHAARRSRVLEAALIPVLMAVFSLGGAVFGMSEETIPFILIFVPLALALGYDTLVGVSIPFLGSAAGFAAAFINPFTVQVAQGIAGVPPLSGFGFRVGLWFVTTGVTIGFVMWHAGRIRRDPTKSPTYAIDERKRHEGLHLDEAGHDRLSGRQWGVLGVFFAGLALLVWGVLTHGWYITEIAALFVGLAIAMGVVGGLGADTTAKSFMDGARDLVATAILIGLSRGILVILEDAQVIDPILNTLAGLLGGAGATVSAMAMFAVQTAINFFVPSGSGQAALTMPVMAPLSDLLGVSRQTAVLAFQMGDGFTNMIIPTSAVLMGVLTLAGVPWPSWARWVAPLQITLFLLGLAVLAVAVAVGYA